MPRLSFTPPRLSYGITRDLPWRLEWIVYCLAFLLLVILVPVNCESNGSALALPCCLLSSAPECADALNGYELVSRTSPNFNAVPFHWFYRFTGAPLPGTLCDPYRLNIGESFITNYGLFPWTLRNVLPRANGTGGMSSNIYYQGESLNSCRLTAMTMELETNPRSAVIGAEVWCGDADVPFVMGTTATLAGAPSTTEGPFSTGAGHSLPLDASILYVLSNDTHTHSPRTLLLLMIGYLLHISTSSISEIPSLSQLHLTPSALA